MTVIESAGPQVRAEDGLDTSATAAASAPVEAVRVFGDRLPIAEAFVALLADTGVSHGLIGPREVPRLWQRHVLNCAVVAEAMPQSDASVIDVGSGAGLPGIALAIARPDLRVTLVEPLLRRTTWLTDSVAALAISNVEVRRARAEEVAGELHADYVTARAVAALDKLARWCAPLVRDGGQLVAMKGSSADVELAAAGKLLPKLGLRNSTVRTVGAGIVDPPTTVIVLDKSTAARTMTRRR